MIATPNIQVAPNRSTSRAFASLGNLLNVATKVQQAKTAEEAASAQNTEYVDTNNTLVTMASQHTENVLAAGTDLEKLAVANETMTSGLSSLQASISEHTQNRMAGLFRGLQTRADASYQTQAHGIKKDNFNDGLQSVASTFSKQTLEAQQGILEDLKGEATNLGIDKKTFGKDFSSAIYNNQMASMDTEQMALNGDYSQLNTMKATIDHMKILDPKDTESHAAALKKYNTLKNSVDSAVVSSVTAARIAEKVDVFATNGAHAVKNGAMSQEAFNLESARFLKSMTGKVSLGKRKALSLFEGGIPILNEQSAEVATHAKKMFNDSVKAKLLAEGGKDVNWLQEAKTKNPTEYAKIANSFVVNKANALESMMTKGATPEDMMPVLQDMYAAENLTFNTTDVKTLLSMDVMAHYITSGAIDNGAKAMTALRAAGETTMMNGNDDYMIKLSKDLPQGESARAQRMYSALAQSGEMDKGAAYEIVTNRFKSIDIEGVEVSNNVVNFLTSVGAPGTTEGQVGALKEVLTDMFTVTPDKAGAFATLFEGNNPNVRINGNTLIAENGDGAYELLNLDNETLGRLKKGLTDTYTTNNLPDNVDALMSDGADVVASTLNDVIFTGQNNKMVDALQGAGALPVLVVGGISRSMQDRADILLESLDTFYGKVDTFIGDVRSGKRTATQAFNDFRQSNKDVVKAYATAAKAKNSEAYKQYEKETSEAGAVFADSWENLSTHTSNAIKAIGDAVISPAYGSDKPGNQTINPVSNIPTETHYKNVIQGAESNHGSTPVVSNDGKLRDGKKTNDIGYGHKITDAEEKSGLIHGIPFGDNTPLTEANMQTIFDKDMAVNLTVARTSGWDATLKAMKPTKTWDDLDTKYQRVLASLAYNMGGKVASTFKKALTAAVDKNDVTFAKELRRMTTVAATATKKSYKKHTAGMDNRAMKELYAAGFITTQAEYDLYKKNLPLAKTASYNGMTL